LLLTAVIAQGRDRGLASLWLSVQADNLRAQTFYRKNGFVPVGTAEFQVGDLVEIDHLFERLL
jgi:ribosomal protein S18 acetylase RimI-like enzyme